MTIRAVAAARQRGQIVSSSCAGERSRLCEKRSDPVDIFFEIVEVYR